MQARFLILLSILLLAGLTESIALGVSSIILPLRHPAQIAKAAASVDVLSGGRLIMGIASGDRPAEYPALNVPFDSRGRLFRESYSYIRKLAEDQPKFGNAFGSVNRDSFEIDIDKLPKPVAGQLPMLITGGSQQDDDRIACNGDGWMIYPRNTLYHQRLIADWRYKVPEFRQITLPVMQPLYFDLDPDPEASPHPIHLGFRSGIGHLSAYLPKAREIRVYHVALNLRFNRASIDATLEEIANLVLSEFH